MPPPARDWLTLPRPGVEERQRRGWLGPDRDADQQRLPEPNQRLGQFGIGRLGWLEVRLTSGLQPVFGLVNQMLQGVGIGQVSAHPQLIAGGGGQFRVELACG